MSSQPRCSSRAFVEYAEICEERRQLAVDAGEIIGRMVDSLVQAGVNEREARRANLEALFSGRFEPIWA